MKAHHKLIHAFDTTRHYITGITLMESSIALLQGEDLYGYPIEGLTVEDAKAALIANCNNIKMKFSDLKTFLEGHETYVLENYTNTSRAIVLADKIKADTFADNLSSATLSASISSLDKLSKISIVNELNYITPVQLEIAYHYAVMLNDWLDASSYTLRGIRERDGLPHKYTDEQIKKVVRGYLNQFSNITWYPAFSKELQTEVDEMVSIQQYVLAHLDDTEFLVLADYIDVYPKTPLIRRLWAIG